MSESNAESAAGALAVSLDEAIAAALAHHRSGRLEEAERIYRQVLEADPRHIDALHLLGVIAQQTGNYEAALRLMDQALELHPNYVEALNNRGYALQRSGREEEARASYESALAIDPGHVGALNNRGNVLQDLGRLEEALASYDRAVAISPAYAEAWANRGNALHKLRHYDEALESYARALALKPDYPDALSNRASTLQELGRDDEAMASVERAVALAPDSVQALNNRSCILVRLKRYEEALASCDRALAHEPDYAEALANRACILHELKRFEEAVASYDRALELRPDHAEALNNRGNALHALKRYEEALESYDRALAADPDYADALCNRASTLHELGRYDEAFASFERALAARPGFAEALNNRGSALLQLGRYEEALASYDEALSVAPDHAAAHWNRALCALVLGDFDHGWQEYEWRWKCAAFPSEKRAFEEPLWLGDADIGGKTILLHAEQGLGDTIQFVRYADAVARKGATVVLEVQAPLKSLLASSFPQYQVLARGEPLPSFDYQCPLVSLPLAFRTRLATIPASVPYLTPTLKVEQWRDRIGPRTRPRVGIVWSGQSRHSRDRFRSIALRDMLPLADCGAQLVSLQREVREADRPVLATSGQIMDCGNQLEDFSDTAAVVSLLDLVIAVDTSVAHLAGAMGKPVWILLPYAPDWRWLLGREDSPWYPTARLFRQERSGDWRAVLRRVAAELTRFAFAQRVHAAASPPSRQ